MHRCHPRAHHFGAFPRTHSAAATGRLFQPWRSLRNEALGQVRRLTPPILPEDDIWGGRKMRIAGPFAFKPHLRYMQTMADVPDNLVLLHLRELRAGQDAMRETLADLVTRVGRVETVLAQVRVELAEVHTVLAEHSVKTDRIGARLDRIEKRLGLIDA